MSGATLIAAGIGLLAGAALERGRRAILDPGPFLDDDQLDVAPRRPSGAVTTRHLAALPSPSTTTTDPQETQP